MEIISAYQRPKLKVQLICEDPSRAKQSMKEETDINFIIRRFQKTGVIEHAKQFAGTYEDFMDIDFHQAMNVVAEAESMFLTVPSSIRKRFNNDPGEFLAFATDPKNLTEMREIGLAPAAPDVTQPPVPVSAAAAAPEPASGTGQVQPGATPT